VKKGETNKRKAGRPEAKIDWGVVTNYLKAQCDSVGIAGILGISVDTLYRRCKIDNKIDYTVFVEQKKSEGKEMLRAVQFKTALGSKNEGINPNVTMQIWLGKQYLGQEDKQKVDSTITFPVLPSITIKTRNATD